MNNTICGYILKQQDYKEKDALITCFTKEMGKMTFLARGVRSMKSKNASSLFPFSMVEILFDYKENSELQVLHKVTTLNMNRHIQQNLSKNSFASIACEVIDKLFLPLDADEEAFEILSFLLNNLEKDQHDGLNLCLFLAQILKTVGIEPNVDECVLCGNSKVSAISLVEGGFVCADCSKEVKVKKVTTATLRHFRYLNKASLENYDVLKNYEPYGDEIVSLMNEFLAYHTGIHINSYDFYLKTI